MILLRCFVVGINARCSVHGSTGHFDLKLCSLGDPPSGSQGPVPLKWTGCPRATALAAAISAKVQKCGNGYIAYIRPLSATLQISLPRFISQERIFRGFPWPTKVMRRDREGVSRVICYINIISAMLGFRVRVDDSSPHLTLAIVFHHKCRRAHQKALLTLNMKT